MRKVFYSILLSIIVTVNVTAQASKHVVVISIDGLRPDFYKEDSWGTVNLKQLVEKGSYADGVRGVFPTVTYPSHTTIMTGVMPAKHGIYYNEPFEPNGETGRWNWDYDSVRTPSLWTAIKAAGLTSANVWWPVTVGAPITYNLPEVWALPKTDKKATLALIGKDARPVGLFEEVQQNATGKFGVDDLNSDYLNCDENIARMGSYLIRTYKPNFITIHLPCVDHYQHEEGRIGDRMKQAVAGADRGVKTILEGIERAGLKDSTTVIVLGDHGFVTTHTSMAPNIWLTNAGLLGDVKTGNWKAIFHGGGGSCFLQLKDKNDEQTLKQVKDILAALPEEQKKLFRVVDRKELDGIGADPNAALAIAPIPGVIIRRSTKGEVLKKVKGGTHGYLPDFKEIQTGFIAAGPGIKKGGVIPLMGLEDMAPLIAKLLGIQLPSAEGKLYPAMLK